MLKPTYGTLAAVLQLASTCDVEGMAAESTEGAADVVTRRGEIALGHDTFRRADPQSIERGNYL